MELIGGGRSAGDMPKLLQYIQDRDLWKNSMPDCEAVIAYLYASTLPKTPQYIKMFTTVVRDFEAHPLKYIEKGRQILEVKEELIREILQGLTVYNIDGIEVGLVTSSVYASELGAIISEKYPIGLVMCLREGRYYFSARSNKKNPDWVDVGTWCTKYGGGGHECAAGFSTKTLPSWLQ